MKMKFIGRDGDLGLVHGKWYEVRIESNSRFVYVRWRTGHCPYSSLRNLLLNWEEEL